MADDDKKNKSQVDPVIDPSGNAADMMGDTTGMTGITINTPGTDAPISTGSITSTMSSTKKAQIADQGSDTDDVVSDTPGRLGGSTPQMNAGIDTETQGDALTDAIADGLLDDEDGDKPLTFPPSGSRVPTSISPDEAGEQSVSGDMPDPESDDNTLANAQAVGTQLDEDTENPEEIDIARDIDEAEESLRTH